jgi:hypothetical protein
VIEPMVYPLLRWSGEDALYTETISVVEPFLAASMPDGAEAAWRQGTDRYHGAGAWAALPDSTRAAFLARTPVVIECCHARLSNPTLADDCRRLAVRTLVHCGARSPHLSRPRIDFRNASRDCIKSHAFLEIAYEECPFS